MPTRSTTLTLVILVFVILVVAGYTWSMRHSSEQERLNASDANSALGAVENTEGYTRLDGAPVDIVSNEGEIIVVTAWASWCPSCTTELPKLSTVANDFSDVRFLAINRAEPQTTAERFLRTVNATSGIELLLDPEDRYYGTIDGYAMPETVIYDETGAIVERYRGEVPEPALRTVLQSLTNEMSE